MSDTFAKHLKAVILINFSTHKIFNSCYFKPQFLNYLFSKEKNSNTLHFPQEKVNMT